MVVGGVGVVSGGDGCSGTRWVWYYKTTFQCLDDGFLLIPTGANYMYVICDTIFAKSVLLLEHKL